MLGRPRIDSNDQTVITAFKLPLRMLDALKAQCERDKVSLGSTLRDLITIYLRGGEESIYKEAKNRGWINES